MAHTTADFTDPGGRSVRNLTGGAATKARRLERIATIGLISAVISALAVLGIGIGMLRDLQAREETIARSYRAITAISELEAAAVRIEDAQRGFLLTADAQHLRAYEREANGIPALLVNAGRNLTEASRDDLAGLERAFNSKLAFVRDVVTERRSQAADAAIDHRRAAEGQRLLDSVRQLLDHMQAEQAKLLHAYENDRRQGIERLLMLAVWFVASLGSILALLYGVIYRSRRQARRRLRMLRESETRFRSLTYLSSDWYWEQDERLCFTFVSTEASARSGYSGATTRERTRWEHPGVDLQSADWEAHKALCLAHQPFQDFVYRRVGEDGSARWLSISGEAVFDGNGNFKGYRGVGRDVTRQKQAEQEIIRRRDLYAALSQTNRAIIHLHDPQALFEEVCRVAIEYGHFCLAWIGLLDQDTGWLRPVAVQGPVSPLYTRIRVSIDPSIPEGRGFAAAALREGRHYIVNDFFADPRTAPWAEQARAAGVNSLATFPLKKQGRCVGVLNLHGDETGFFSEELTALLEEMAMNISFALDNMEGEQRRLAAELALHQSEQRFRSLVDLSSDWYWEQDEQFRFVFVSSDHSHGSRVIERSSNGFARWDAPGTDPTCTDWDAHKAVCEAHQPFRDFIFRRFTEDGSEHWYAANGEPVLDNGGRFKGYRGTGKDVTERVVAERERQRAAVALARSEERFQLVSQASNDGIWDWDLVTDTAYYSARFKQLLGYPESDYHKLRPSFEARLHPADRIAAGAALKEHLQNQVPYDVEYRAWIEAGEYRWFHATGQATWDTQGTAIRFTGAMRDITARKTAEQEVLRLSRSYAARSETNQAIGQIKERKPLFEAVCGIAVEYGRFSLAWVGMIDADSQSVLRVALSGTVLGDAQEHAEFLDCEAPEGRELTRLALQDNSRLVCNDYLADARVASWHLWARHAGIRSMAVFPLRQDGIPVGALVLCGGEPGVFTPDLVDMLSEMAFDISCALDNLRAEERRAAMQTALTESEQNFGYLANNIPQVAWIAHPDGRHLTYVSPAYENVWGRPLHEILDSSVDWMNTVHPDDRAGVEAAMRRAQTGSVEHEYRIVRPDGGIRWIYDRAFPVRDELGNLQRMTGIAEDITARKESQERLLYLAHYDNLTQLPNRLLFHDRLHQALGRSAREGRAAAVMFVDLDRFKLVNETLGHAAGDLLLQQVAERIAEAVRPGDTVGRLGGDEFAIILSDLANADHAAGVVAKSHELRGSAVQARASKKSSSRRAPVLPLFPVDGEHADTLVKNAEAAMYRAKELGRSNYQFYKAEMNARSLERLSMESQLRRALERNEFVVYYQPKVDLAQLRHHAASRRCCVGSTPSWVWCRRRDFIPILEDDGLIVPVGEWVLAEACRQIKAWADAGIQPVPVAVNLSGAAAATARFRPPRAGNRCRSTDRSAPDRARDHRKRADAQPRSGGRACCDRSNRSASVCRSTTSAPAIRAWATSSASRWTRSRSTAPSCATSPPIRTTR